jgi:hypothetical protein
MFIRRWQVMVRLRGPTYKAVGCDEFYHAYKSMHREKQEKRSRYMRLLLHCRHHLYPKFIHTIMFAPLVACLAYVVCLYVSRTLPSVQRF